MDHVIASEEGQFHRDRVCRVRRYVEHVLADPHEADRGGEPLSREEEVSGYAEREKYLECASGSDSDEIDGHKQEYRVSRLVKYEIDVIYEVPLFVRPGVGQEVYSRERGCGDAVALAHATIIPHEAFLAYCEKGE